MTLRYFKFFIFATLFLLLIPQTLFAEENSAKANAIFDALKSYILDFDIDAITAEQQVVEFLLFSESEKNKLIKKFECIIEQGLSFDFLCLAFPLKSSNDIENVIFSDVDKAEYYGLSNLNQMIRTIKKIYPKAHLTIVTDGLLFADLFHIQDSLVLTYERNLKKLAELFSCITIISITELLCQTNHSLETIRKEVGCIDEMQSVDVSKFRDRFEILKARIVQEINHPNNPFFHMNSTDQSVYLEKIAFAVIARDEWVKNFIRQFEKANTIRLSIHYQKDISAKIGIKFSSHSRVNPWNGVLVQHQDGAVSIMRKRDVDAQAFKLEHEIYNGVKCAFYNWR